jgi:hypothetical protein
MKPRVLMSTVGAAAAALAAGVILTAPSASAGTPYCDALPPKDARDCNCGFDNAPGTAEFEQCVHGIAAAPGAPAPGTPGPGAPPPGAPPPDAPPPGAPPPGA